MLSKVLLAENDLLKTPKIFFHFHFFFSFTASDLYSMKIDGNYDKQKQTSRGVLSKRCSENMQQIYERTPMPRCDFNKVAKQLY